LVEVTDIAGDKIDEAVIRLIDKTTMCRFGNDTAELIKIMLSSASPDSEIQIHEIKSQRSLRPSWLITEKFAAQRTQRNRYH
jgi:actin-like ATPase involved in cell morphogenesis